ncbi:MAG: flagellar hook-basal body complex protein FliE [Planctomycetes bacterium]|nr:flagellar hook-basal body complex protein FliE [Planctomycetota bacterium]
MSNFDLPPLQGFDPMQRPFFPVGPRVPESGPQEPGLPEAPGATGGGQGGFGAVLSTVLDHVRDLQGDVSQKTRGLVLGEDVELHDVMLAADKTEVSFNLLLEVRNKLVEAWEKLSRSSV